MPRFTICVQEKPGGPVYKLTKIVPYAGGGFAVMAPYHKSGAGLLMKYPVDYSKQNLSFSDTEYYSYVASERVKLSIHPDGFVQFSGERPQSVISGRDSTTGEIKGLGLLSQPLARPIATGPIFSLVYWGISDFANRKPAEERDSIVFGDDDLYYRRCTPETWNGYVLEGFVFPERYWAAVRQKGGQLALNLAFQQFEAGFAVIEFRVVPLAGQDLLLGLIMSRLTTNFPAPSGFALNGPSDLKYALSAIYPDPRSAPTGRSLDYQADS